MKKNFITILVITALFSQCNITQKEKNENSSDKEVKAETESVENIKGPLLGVDVSHYQGKIDWVDAKKAGVFFAYAKALEGITDIDPMFSGNWTGMKEAGVYRGAYHFYLSNDDPLKQANAFVEIVKQLEVNDMPPMLDLEPGGMEGDVDKAKFQKDVLIWLKQVEEKLGMKPIIYTDHPFGNEYLTDKEFANYPLWIAEYGVEKPKIPGTWVESGWLIWQKVPKGQISGINGGVDHDYFNGSLNDLKKILKK